MLNKQQMKERAVGEAKKFVVIVGYVWILFSLFEVHKWMVLRQYNPTHELSFKIGFALINALVLGKVIFTAEALHVAEHFKYRPLIQPILYKSAAFSIILVCFQIIEEVLVGLFHGGTIAQSLPKLGGGGLEGIFLWGIFCFVLLIPFFAFREFGRVIGENELYTLLLRRGARAGTVQSTHQPGTSTSAPKHSFPTNSATTHNDDVSQWMNGVPDRRRRERRVNT